MTKERDREDRTSDVPVDLTKEREQFVRQFLPRAVEITEELLEENNRLRAELASLQADNARLRTEVTADTLRDLETELNDLANVYIASHQLHADLSLRRVVRHLKDTIEQLVGAEAFVIYVLEPETRRVVPLGWEELEEGEVHPIPLGQGPIGEACLTGIALVRDDMRRGSLEDPVAIIPLMVAGRPVGAVAIARMLEQKAGWAPVDRELFKLVGAHGGTALLAANLFANVARPEDALEGLFDNMLRRPSAGPPPDGE